jgi:hypothetical protein
MIPKKTPYSITGRPNVVTNITINSVNPGAFSSTPHDGRQGGIYDTSRYGRCVYALPRRGIYGSDTYGNCTYS